ncbi:MAG TPA: choice-of-anchor J domain-containing protein [Candidatus Cloacimonadota bacterium]|nr:choice-of-anchor J domain-containing protein [Candidatus Cloacimonadota bacterium]HPT71589.1 choice-of-anchor J domain-containing protein [Candidatus Cloacimonadota bacterium]
MKKLLILFFVVLLGYSLLPAIVSEYTFASSIGTYTPITDGTVQGTSANDDHSFNAIPIGFDFTFDSNVTSVVSINSNGFVAFGPTAQTSPVSISNANANASNRLCAVLNRDLKSKTNGVLMTKLLGDAPNRIFVVQWANYQRYGTNNAGDTLNFQLRIHETTNMVEIQYGHIVFGNSNLTNNTFQVGIRGNSNAEFSNRSVVINTNTWTTSIAGTLNTSSCAMSPTFVPDQGLSFQFTPPIVGDTPQPAIVTSPVNNAVDVLLNAHLIWADGGGTPTGYKVYLGTDNPPTNITNGVDVGLTTNYTPAVQFTYSTVYYWQIVPYNQFGDADSLSVWSFTTLADPSILTFPYNEGFEGAYFPPLGWTTTGWIRGSVSHSGTYCARDLYSPAGTRILMTPRIAMGESKRLKFWWRDSDISKVVGHDTTYVEISVDGGTSWTILGSLSSAAVENAYHQVIIDLSPYTSENTYLRWRDVTDGTTSAYGVGLDDISIDTFIPTYNPPTNLTQVSGNASVALTWQAAVIADGMTLSNYKVYRDDALVTTLGPTVLTYNNTGLTNGTTYNYYVTAYYTNPVGESVPSNTVQGHPLAPVFDPPSNLTAIQTAWNAVTLSWLLPGETPPGITEGFEGTFPPTGWTQTITNTGAANSYGVYPTWCQIGTVNSETPIPPHAGNNQVGLWLSFSHQDEWLMTPQFNCPASANLSFWSYCHQGSTNADHYYVKISTNNGTSWTTLWDASALPVLDNLYTSPYNISLSAYANQNIKLAWHAIDGPDMDGLWYVWFIDAVTVSAGKHAISFKASDFTIKSASSNTTQVRVVSQGASNALTRDGSAMNNVQLPTRNLTGVKVYRNGALLQTIANTSTHQYIDATVVPNTYIYKVTCYYSNPNGESVFSNEAPVTIAPYVFNPPTNFSAVAGNAQVVLTWAAPTSGTPTGYKVYRNSTLVTTLGPTVLTYTNAGLVNGISYEYWVTATYTNPTGESAGTTHITATPQAPVLNPPTNLSGTIIANNSVHLTWQAPTRILAAREGKDSMPDRSHLGYRVYKNNEAIQDIMNTATLQYDVPDLPNASYSFKVTALYTDGESVPSNVITIVGNDDPVIPARTALNGNYPNPFNPTTDISFSLNKAGFVTIEIFNTQGHKIKTLVSKQVEAGNHSISWNGNDDKGNPVGSGMYFYKMKSGNYSSTKKMILLK